MDTREERIRSRAYEIWQREGQPHGRHDEHWQRAEAEMGDTDSRDGTASSESVRAPNDAPTLGPPQYGDDEPATPGDAEPDSQADAIAPDRQAMAPLPPAARGRERSKSRPGRAAR